MMPQELKNLLNQMTLEEKIGELVQLPGWYFDSDVITGPAAQMGLTQEDFQVIGSCLSVIGAKKLKKLQKDHIQNHPHHIPMLFMGDVINGFRTVFPVPLALGCSFDPQLAEDCASIAAAEASASGIHVTFSPMADLTQDPRWGRVMEGTGEDPYLNGLMAAAMVRGYQGPESDLTKKGKIAACLKHFAGYGAPIAGRDYNTAELSERTLRQDYLPAYRAAVDAGCKMVMTSFNTLDRIPSTANRWLLEDVLRGEMGFQGTVITDYDAIPELIAHGVARDMEDAAALAMDAGVDIDMATSAYIKNLKTLVAQGRISQKAIDDAALRVLALKNDLGLFENPWKDASEEDEKNLILCQSHRAAARNCAEKTFVLLKNQGQLLPLDPEQDKIAVIGPYTECRQLNGAWSVFGNDNDCVTLKEGILTCFPQASAAFAQGCLMMDPESDAIAFHKRIDANGLDPKTALEQAISLAREADKVILALGEPRNYTGEACSRSELTLPQCQMELLRQVSAVNPNVCVVLFNGRPLDLREMDTFAQAILEAWFPGVEAGNALARVLFGSAVPSGKLSMSFPYCLGQVPVFYNHLNTGRPLQGDYRKVNFKSTYLDIPNEPLFPFGYGLSYTAFACSDITLNSNTLCAGETITASVTVTNTGDRTGTETVQLYIRDLWGSVSRPVRELKGFRKVTLAPGENRLVSFTIDEPMLRFYDIRMNLTSEPGDFEISVGFDSTSKNTVSFTLIK